MAFNLQDFFVHNGQGQDGATVNLYNASIFPTPPKQNDPLPAASGILATVVTDPQYGGNGASRFTVAGGGPYVAAIQWNGSITYKDLVANSNTALSGTRWFNVTNYGAVGGGVTNDTTAINSAIADAVNAGGGVVYFPPGKYAVNLTITNDNITLQGDSHTLAGSPTNCLVPYASGSPVITIGADVARINYGLLRDLTLHATGPNGVGKIGLYLLSPNTWNFQNLWVHGFTQNCLLIQGGFTQPAELCWFSQCQFQPASVCTDAGVSIVYPVSGSQWTTDVYFDQCQFVSPSTSGHALVIDSTQVYFSNSFVNGHDMKGIQFRQTSTIGPHARAYCNWLGIDSGNANDTLIELSTTNQYVGGNFIGTVNTNAHYQNSDGSVNRQWLFAGALGDRLNLSAPFMIGGLSFGDTGQAYNTNHQINGSVSMNVTTTGNLFITHGDQKKVFIQSAVGSGICDAQIFSMNNSQWKQFVGTGTPNGQSFNNGTSVPSGSLYHQSDGDPGRLLWINTTGAFSSGWRPITTHVPYRAYSNSSASGSVSVAVDDLVVGINGSAVTKVQLPATPAIGRRIIIKDIAGTAASFAINIYGNGSGNIDGAGVLQITTNYGKATMVYDGSAWWTI